MYTPLSVVGEGEDLVEIKVLEPLVKEQYRSHRDAQEAIYKPKRIIHHIEEWSRLDISYNGLRIISPSIAQFSQLTELYLNHNQLSLLPVELFTVLLSLRRLDLSYNQIMWIPPDISNLLQLQVLSLVHNQIRELPVEMGKLFRLEKLEIDGNPIISPTIDVLQQDAMFITSFLREKMPTGDPPPPREWQYNTALSNADMKATLRVMCYNILADSYTGPATVYCPRWAVHWDYRKQRLLNELNQCNADVIGLQEVENESFTTYFEPEMERLGYLGVFRPKSRARTKEDVRRVDGCAIFFKSELFDLLDLQLIEFQQLAMHKYEQLTGKKTNNSHDSGLNRLMTKDNIALAVLLRVKSRARARLPHDRIMVVTTHIHWDPEYCDVKLMQTQLMLEQLEELNARYLAQINKERGKQAQGWLPMLLCGDFNSMPDSGVYQLLHTGHVDNNHQDFVDYQYGSYTATTGTGLNHNIPLRSSYAQVGGEPPFTNFTSDFVGVLDYIWYTPHAFTPLRVLKGVDPSIVLSSYGALPNPFMCSDHIPLLVEVLFASPQSGFAASPQKFKH